MLGLNRYYMKILSFLFALVVGFNVENAGSEKFVASELVKVECQLPSLDIKSVLVLQESEECIFEVKNCGIVLSKDLYAGKLTLGAGNFKKSDLYLQKMTPGFSLWSDDLLSFVLKGRSMFSLPTLSLGKQPLGFGFSLFEKNIVLSGGVFSLKNGMPNVNDDFSAYVMDIKNENHCGLLSFGFQNKKKVFFSNFIGVGEGKISSESIIGYSTLDFYKNGKIVINDDSGRDFWILPFFVENLNFQFGFNGFRIKSGSEIRMGKNYLSGLKFCFQEELEFIVSKFDVKIGFLACDFDFPLLNNKMIGKDLGVKINPKVKFGKNTLSVSLMGERLWNYKFSKVSKKFEKTISNWDVSGGVSYSYDFEKSLLIVKSEYENIFNTKKASLLGSFEWENDFWDFELIGKIKDFEKSDLLDFSDYQFTGKIEYKDKIENITFESNLKLIMENRTFVSEDFSFGFNYDFLEIKLNLKIDNEKFYDFLKEKKSEKSGINFGISGTINL